MTEVKSGIYCIENLINGKKYVGQGQNVEKRMVDPHYECKILNNAFKKYGKHNFLKKVIEYCDVDDLDDREVFWIKQLKSHISEHGYNVGFGGSAPMRGRRHSPESIEKIRAYKPTEETIERQRIASTGENNPMFGRKHSEESNRKNSESQTGEKSHAFGKKKPNATSKYFGVRLTHRGIQAYYQAEVCFGGKCRYIGIFKKEEDAARKYDEYVVKNNLPNNLNFPNCD